MAMVEVDEVELLNSRKLRDTVAKIAADPKLKVQLQKLHRAVEPTAIAPELDALSALDENKSETTKRIEDLEKKLTAQSEAETRSKQIAELNARVDKGIKALRDARWTDEGIKGVREVMEAKGLLDPEDAAAIFEKQNPSPAPITPTAGSGSWDFIGSTEAGGDDALKKLVATRGNSEGVTDAMVRDILADVRGPSRR